MTLQIVVGGEYGSEGKGAVTAAICNREANDGRQVTVVRVGGPNAGHSAVDHDGNLWALRQIPVGMVVNDRATGVIACGSEIDPPVLIDEIERLEAAGHSIADRLYISEEATIITDEHKEREGALVGKIGSTGKGIGAARADRIMRTAPRVADAPALGTFDGTAVESVRTKTGREMARMLNSLSNSYGSTVIIEGTQGYGLGLRAGYYPQVTSSDCRAVDFLSMAGINPWGLTRDPIVHVVVRPYPIRVAGNSGPLKGETSWAELGLSEELTTVTKKVRRVGEWDEQLVLDALQANGPGARLAVSMLDQVPNLTHMDGQQRALTLEGKQWLNDLSIRIGARVGWYGVGPTLADWRKL